MLDLALKARASQQRCVWCHDDLDTEVACPGCNAAYHPECAGEADRCGVTGCRRRLPNSGTHRERRLGSAPLGNTAPTPAVVGIRRRVATSLAQWVDLMGRTILVLALVGAAGFLLNASYEAQMGGQGAQADIGSLPLFMLSMLCFCLAGSAFQADS